MAKRDDMSKARPGRSRTQSAPSGASSLTEPAVDPNCPPLRRLQQAIEKERMHLLLTHSMLIGLHDMLLYSDDDDGSFWADLAKVAAKLVDDAAAQLDWMRLKGVLSGAEAEKNRTLEHAYETRLDPRTRHGGVKEDHPQYVVSDPPLLN